MKEIFIFGLALAALAAGCKKNNPVQPTVPVDPQLVGDWYSTSFGAGFEVHADGTTRNLSLDTSGRVEYTTGAADSILQLTILDAKNGVITIRAQEHVPGLVDTTVIIPGQYELTNSGNTLTLTIPDPTSGELTPIQFQRTMLGAMVISKRTDTAERNDERNGGRGCGAMEKKGTMDGIMEQKMG